ncbi:Uncharacterized protein NEOC65_000073 [Neochlamydia sp. AcF65]|uniref:hypothetical protein n=1 Tax=Neochlamydia sp. AcF65 TaxID=2795735 RepID=UPI001BC90DC8|nr:hypothetical protein [Neochlamydia sp. AcF65]MBS4165026.1 Uncharacterized protein [Neochlamydia sp. AcF65]
MNKLYDINSTIPLMHQIMQADSSQKDMLHPKPLCHRLHYVISNLGTHALQHLDAINDQGALKRGITKGILISGYLLNTVFASIELISALFFSTLAYSLQALRKDNNLSMQKTTLKSFAYALNISAIMVKQFLQIINLSFSKYHSYNAFLNDGLPIFAMLSVLPFGNKTQLSKVKKTPTNLFSYAEVRALRFLIDYAPSLLDNITQGAKKDYVMDAVAGKLSTRYPLSNDSFPSTFLRHYTPERQLNGEYYHYLLSLLLNAYQTSYLQGITQKLILKSSPILTNILEDETTSFIPKNLIEDEKDAPYQHNLKYLIKLTYKNIYENPDLVCTLSQTLDEKKALAEGREILASFLATSQVANYAQFQEIISQIVCPAKFNSPSLQVFNKRKQLITSARQRIAQLSVQEENILINKLLKTGNYDLYAHPLAEERLKLIEGLFKDIVSLAGALYHGPLLQQSFTNLHQEACQEALREIEKNENLINFFIKCTDIIKSCVDEPYQ